MEKFKYTNITFFDSKDLRVGVNVINSKTLDNKKEIELVYEAADSIGINPSIYVIWAFKHDNGKYTSGFTSYPHIRNIKLIMTDIVEHITTPTGGYVDSFVDKEWVSVTLGNSGQYLVFKLDSELNKVIIELYNNHGDAIAGAAMGLDSFMGLNEGVQGVNLTDISINVGLSYLASSNKVVEVDGPKAPYTPRKESKPQSGYVKPNSGSL